MLKLSSLFKRNTITLRHINAPFCQLPHKQYLQRLQRQKQLQRIAQDNDSINMTTGKFNPLFSYIWLYRRSMGLILAALLASYFIFKVINILGFERDFLTSKKIFLWVSSKTERERNDEIEYLLKSELQEKELIRNPSDDKIRKVEKMLTDIVGKDMGINVGRDGNGKVEIECINNVEHIIVVLPSRKVLLSANLFQRSEFTSEMVTMAVLLMLALFERKFHIRELSWVEQDNYIGSANVIKKLKWSQIYQRKYSSQEISETIDLLSNKCSVPKEKIQTMLTKLEKISKNDQKKQSIRHRLGLE